MEEAHTTRSRNGESDRPPPLSFAPREWTGAIGDAAVLLPLVLAMDRTIDFPLARSFGLAGAAYIAGGLYYRIPMPVQPLKAMAAAVLAQGLPFEVVRYAAGILAACLLAGGALAGPIEKLFPRPVVKGIQLGLGILLLRAGLRLLSGAPPPAAPKPDSPTEAVAAAVAFLVVPQLPLTIGNSIYAASDAAREYFGRAARRATPRALFLDLAGTNALAAAIGAYPLCRGSGGVTAHYAFGARTGGAAVLAGLACLTLAAAGPHAAPILRSIPDGLLGACLLYIGVRHALLLRSLEGRAEWGVALISGLAGGAAGNLAVSLGAAWAALLGMRLAAFVRAKAGG